MNQLQALTLGLLYGAPLFGYQVLSALSQEPYVRWGTADDSDIYEALRALGQSGMVELRAVEAARGHDGRVLYAETASGRTALLDWVRDSLDEAAGELDAELALAFLDLLSPTEATRLLEATRARLLATQDKLREATSQPGSAGAKGVAAVAASERALHRVEGDLAWVASIVERIQRGDWQQVRPAQTSEPVANSTAMVAVQTRGPAASRPPAGAGAFTFVLHSHLPYCRMAGRWPHGEEWLHEAMAETYIPLLNALYDLRDEGVAFRLTLSLTPVLVEQLADGDVQEHFVHYLDEEIEGAEADIPRFGEQGDQRLERLAVFYRDLYRDIRARFIGRYGRDLVGAFRLLQDEGYVQVITCAATHGYLPLLARDSSIFGQLQTAVISYKRHFGRRPTAIWLPECAYRPAYQDADGTIRPAIEEYLAEVGITAFFAETHAIEGSRPVGKAAGEAAIGPYSAIKRRYVVPIVERADSGGTTFLPYYVAGGAHGLTEPPVAVVGRNNRTGQQVWSGDWGYPGDADYREFHRKDAESGLQYWRVTGPTADLGAKDLYEPEWAAGKVRSHSAHFASLVASLLTEYRASAQRYGIISANYDTELFGHWWFEGIEWIKQVLASLTADERVDVMTVDGYLAQSPPQEVMAIPESSWGSGGTHWTWDNDDTHWMWEPIHRAEERMEQLVVSHPTADGDLLLALNQAARELLLLQSSDWPFLVTTGQAKEYSIQRFSAHVDRFGELCDLIAAHDLSSCGRLARELYTVDNVFPDVDYRWFAPRQG